MSNPVPDGHWQNLTKYKHFERRQWTIRHAKCQHKFWICRCSQCGASLASEKNHPLVTGRVEDFVTFLERQGYKVEPPRFPKETEVYVDKLHPYNTNRISNAQTRRHRIAKRQKMYNFDLNDGELKNRNK